MPPAVVPVEDGSAGEAAGVEVTYYSCHAAWFAWWNHVRCVLASTFLPCPPAPTTKSAIVRGTLTVPSAGDRRVRLFLQEHGPAATDQPVDHDEHFLVVDLPAGLGGADIAAAGRIVLEYQRQWTPPNASPGALLDSTKWLVYCKGTRVGYATRRERPSDAEGWLLEKLRAVTAGAGWLPSGGVEYLRGRFERIVASSDAESFHLTEWPGVHGGGFDGGLSIFFHRVC